MWFKPKPFHQSKEWTALAKLHKSIERDKGNWYCVDCGATDELESDHILPQSLYPNLRLQIRNLCLRCKACNLAKGSKVYADFHSTKVLVSSSFRYAIRRLMLVIVAVILLHLLQWLYEASSTSSPFLDGQSLADSLETIARGFRDYLKQYR
jgi:hypothetical protein